MELEEYMLSMAEWITGMESDMTGSELDNVDYTIRSVTIQMGWDDKIRVIEEEMYDGFTGVS